jgi:hypothetical protein
VSTPKTFVETALGLDVQPEWAEVEHLIQKLQQSRVNNYFSPSDRYHVTRERNAFGGEESFRITIYRIKNSTGGVAAFVREELGAYTDPVTATGMLRLLIGAINDANNVRSNDE